MAGRLQGKVAFITGAARGQGRSHAVRLAQEGADIIAVDLCKPVPSVQYSAATEADLEQTVKEVEATGRRIFARKADVRDLAALRSVVADGVAKFGRLDVVIANAGIFTFGKPAHEFTEQEWDDTVDINLKGVWLTTKAAVPAMIEAGNGGSIVLVSSSVGMIAGRNVVAYTTAKHGVVGLMRALAVELGQYGIRANSIHPNTVDTPMIKNDGMYHLFRPDLPNPTLEDAVPRFEAMNVLPVAWSEPADISNAVLYLVSDDARYVTGTELKVDAGTTIRH